MLYRKKRDTVERDRDKARNMLLPYRTQKENMFMLSILLPHPLEQKENINKHKHQEHYYQILFASL